MPITPDRFLRLSAARFTGGTLRDTVDDRGSKDILRGGPLLVPLLPGSRRERRQADGVELLSSVGPVRRTARGLEDREGN